MVLAVATVLLEVLVWEFHVKEKPCTDWFLRLSFLSLIVAMVEIGTDVLNQTELNQTLISCTSAYQDKAE
jgi:hypothetical protein